MGVLISPKRLDREMARRGWTSADLAEASGLSGATIATARAGRPISPRTAGTIARAFARTKPLDEIDSLLL